MVKIGKVGPAAERGKAWVEAYGSDADPGEEDIAMMLADLDAYLLSTGRRNVVTVATYGHQIHLDRAYYDKVWLSE